MLTIEVAAVANIMVIAAITITTISISCNITTTVAINITAFTTTIVISAYFAASRAFSINVSLSSHFD